MEYRTGRVFTCQLPQPTLTQLGKIRSRGEDLGGTQSKLEQGCPPQGFHLHSSPAASPALGERIKRRTQPEQSSCSHVKKPRHMSQQSDLLLPSQISLEITESPYPLQFPAELLLAFAWKQRYFGDITSNSQSKKNIQNCAEGKGVQSSSSSFDVCNPCFNPLQTPLKPPFFLPLPFTCHHSKYLASETASWD